MPLLITVDGEAKTAKTTAGSAISYALREQGMNVFEADAGAFFRRLTVGALELLGFRDLTGIEVLADISETDLHRILPEVIEKDLAYEKREWGGLIKFKIVEKYVSVIGKTIDSQNAMDDWYGRMLQAATQDPYDVLVINARNPRERLLNSAIPVPDLPLVYCKPREAARRILFARGNKNPTPLQLNVQETDVVTRRTSDRERSHYPYVEPEIRLPYTDETPAGAESSIRSSWSL